MESKPISKHRKKSFAEHKERRRRTIDLERGLLHQAFIEEDLIIKFSLKKEQFFVGNSLVYFILLKKEATKSLGIIVHSMKLFEGIIIEGNLEAIILGHLLKSPYRS